MPGHGEAMVPSSGSNRRTLIFTNISETTINDTLEKKGKKRAML